MKNGAKTDILTLKLSTPLHIAAEYECEAMVNKLLANMWVVYGSILERLFDQSKCSIFVIIHLAKWLKLSTQLHIAVILERLFDQSKCSIFVIKHLTQWLKLSTQLHIAVKYICKATVKEVLANMWVVYWGIFKWLFDQLKCSIFVIINYSQAVYTASYHSRLWMWGHRERIAG